MNEAAVWAALAANAEDMRNLPKQLPGAEVAGSARCASLGCSNPGTLRCARCKIVRYCGAECQKADWKSRHKASCGQIEFVAASDGNDMIAALASGMNGGWYTGLHKRARVYERFYMSYQLRVEDEYTMCGETYGTYGTQAQGGPKSWTSKEFKLYYERAKGMEMFPPDWSKEDEKKLLKEAENQIHFAIEKSDVIERFGYGSGEHFVLRSMAESIVGPIGSWLYDDSSSEREEVCE
eukprot:gene27234-2488_t